MQYAILTFGAILLAAGALILIRPAVVFGFLGSKQDSVGIHVLAVVVRLLLGAALIFHSENARFPLTLEILGWITVVAAIALGLMGRANFRKLMNWAINLSHGFGRIAGVFAMLLGGFLIYAV